MGATQQFSLRWNNYVQHITCAFDSLRTDEDLVDVTLSCEGRKIYAHKMLLSACSDYFKDVFKENPCKHPVIIFRNVKYEDLLAIIDFMYHGEVNVEQEQLSSFLTTAEMLAVQGLSVGSTAPKEEVRKKPLFFESTSVSSPQETSQVHQNKLKAPSRPLGTQNPPGPGTGHPRSPLSPTLSSRKRRLSPPSKVNNVEKEIVVKRRPKETAPMKLETEEAEEESFCEDEGMMDVSQLELSREEEESINIKQEASISPELGTEKVSSGPEQSKTGQASTSSNLETAGTVRFETIEVDEEYLEEEDDEEEEYETAYVVVGENGQLEYVDESAVLTGDIEDENTILIDSRDHDGKRTLLLQAGEDEDGEGPIQYIYAEGVNENNEIIIGEVPCYTCGVCERTFKRLDSLYKHNSMHSGRTECPACGAVFSRVAHLTRHMGIKHPEWKKKPRSGARAGRKPKPKQEA